VEALDKVYHAAPLLRELGVGRRHAPPQTFLTPPR